MKAIFAAAALLTLAFVSPALAVEQVQREQDIGDIRLGQRVLVDDGTCPAGQIKEVVGARMTANGVQRTLRCIPRITRR